MKTNTKNLGIHCVWTAVLLILLGESAAAQSLSKYISPNAPTSGSITYNSISSSGYALPSWRNDTAGTYNVDDDRSYSIPIGFDFWYIGQRYTTVNVSTNGYIDFSSETWDGGPGIGWRQYNPYGPYSCDLSSTARPSYYGGGTVLSNGTALAIAPFLFDLTTQYNVDPLGDGIKYLVGGTAPNRTLTVEWYTMGVYTNTTPSLNFQVVLHEGSGQIEFNYGTMTAGTYANWHYAVGMSGANVNSSHLVEATANTPSSFSTSSTQWQLATLPTSNSQIVFTPPAVSAPTNYGDTNVTQTSMMIKWSNPTDANRLGFAVYRSDDGGATYNFIRTVASTATSSTESGLLSGVTYYWKIYAYSEGALSTPLIGFRATSAPTNFVSITSGSWSNGATWNAGGTIPNISSSVTIADGHTVTIDTTVANAANITVGQGGGSASTLLIGGSNAIARTINVTGDITVRANGILRANTASVTTGHIINAMGNFYNNGTIDLAPSGSSACSVNFNKAGGQTISGPGTQTNFYKMTLNMGSSSANVLDVFSSNFTDATSGFLTINNGTFRLSTSATVTPFSAGANIPIQGGFWLNAAGTVNTAGNLQVTGNLRVSNGTLNIGSATDHSLISNGGTFLFEGGVANVSGIFRPLNDFTLTTFTMMGGTLNVATVGSTSTTNAPFTIRVPGSSFEMTGGLIVIKQGTSTGLGYVNTGTSRSVVLGGTLQMFDGTAATPTLAKIKTDVPVYNLVVNSLSASAAQLDSLPLTVKANVSIQGSASLRANYLDLFVGGDWTSSGGFFPTAARVTFNGLSSQTITDPIAGVNFYNWTINKAAGSVLMSGNVTVNGAFALSQGTLNVQSSTLTLDSAATSAGTLSMSTTAPFGTVQYLQPLAGQIILAANYGNLTLNAYSKTFPAGTVGVAHTLTVPNPATSHVLTGNTIDFNGSAPQSVAGTTANFIYNNLTMSGAGAKTATGATTINGLLTVSSGVSFADGGNSITAKANVINQGTHSGTGSLQLTPGSAAHQLSGTGQYGNLTINDGNGATLAANLIVSGALTLTSGVINASTYTVKILQGGSVSPGPGYVQGRMQRFFDASTLSQVFAIGDVAGYTPATVQFAAVTNPGGYLTVNTTNGDHANVASSTIDGSNSVNRYWTVASDGFVFSTYSAAFTYVAADVDVPGNELTFKVGRYNAGWTYPTLGTVNSTSAQGTGITLPALAISPSAADR
ncbi:MAG: hypothetical protein NTV54_06620 [Ignavibacteriales bacterium]|nr:hypothetical protein [Ignavibacteriales bacterium]